MAYTVSRITASLRKYALLDIADMKDEKCRFWLEDKAVRGNIFQRHFNLINMMKDVYVCVLLLWLYKYPGILMILLFVQQLSFLGLVICFPPYQVRSTNLVLQITQGFYLLLDIAFLVNIYGNISPNLRYFMVGFWMIGTVLGIILTNIAVSAVEALSRLLERCRRPSDTNPNVVSPMKDLNASRTMKDSSSLFFKSEKENSKLDTSNQLASSMIIPKGLLAPPPGPSTGIAMSENRKDQTADTEYQKNPSEAQSHHDQDESQLSHQAVIFESSVLSSIPKDRGFGNSVDLTNNPKSRVAEPKVESIVTVAPPNLTAVTSIMTHRKPRPIKRLAKPLGDKKIVVVPPTGGHGL